MRTLNFSRPCLQVVGYGVGNIGSLRNAVDFIGGHCIVVDDPMELRFDTHILLPGVGAFQPAATALRVAGWVAPLGEAREAGTPILGVCLGMQLLFQGSQEADMEPGLGWFEGEAVSLQATPKSPVPHMGWDQVVVARSHPVAGPVGSEHDYYFAHSYAVPASSADLLATTTTETGEFASVVGRENVLGVQFHPEKSQAVGLALLSRFLEWQPC